MLNPIKCSQCDNLYAVSGKPHCSNLNCDWVICNVCDLIVSKSHNGFIPAPKIGK